MVSLSFCGHLGPKEYSAATLATTFVNIAGFSIIIGLCTASETLFPQLFGSNKKKQIGLVLQKGLIISFLACLLVMSVFVNAKNIIRFFIHEEDVLEWETWFLYYSFTN